MSMRVELQESARKALAGALAPDTDKIWTAYADLGWFGVAAPEGLGGLGLGTEEICAIHIEIGRALAPDMIAQTLVIEALAQADDFPERPALVDRALKGERFTAPLVPEGADGRLRAVPDADKAAHVLAFADGGRRCVLHALAGATMERRVAWDGTRRLFDLSAPSAPLVLAVGARAQALAARLQSRLLFALAADSLGGADAVLGLTIDYLKTRRQFDRPLAMFQALKHRCADLKTQLAAAEAMLWARAGAPGASPAGAGALKALATTVYRTIAEEAIQLHGGIGLTEEHPCHLFLKRAMLNCALGEENDSLEAAAGRAALDGKLC